MPIPLNKPRTLPRVMTTVGIFRFLDQIKMAKALKEDPSPETEEQVSRYLLSQAVRFDGPGLHKCFDAVKASK